MGWKLFLDDERFPTDSSYIVRRDVDSAIDLIKELGIPDADKFITNLRKLMGE